MAFPGIGKGTLQGTANTQTLLAGLRSKKIFNLVQESICSQQWANGMGTGRANANFE